MDTTPTLPEAVQWTEGMLLSPQHLQQNDIYWHEQLQHRIRLGQPYHWGLRELAFSPDALAAGKLVIERLHAVMPDGLVVQYPGAYDPSSAPLALDVSAEELWPEGRNVLRIWLAVPIRSEGAASPKSRIQRFDAVPGRFEVDEVTGAGTIEVDRLRPRLALIAGPEVHARYTAFPLLELSRAMDKGVHLTGYHPPLLRLAAAAFLGEAQLCEKLGRLAEAIRLKIRALVGGRSIDANVNNLDGKEREELAICRHLATALPAIEVRLRSGEDHPYEVYLELARLTGRLASIGADPLPPLLEPYRHEDCDKGFAQALDFASSRLSRIRPWQELMDFVREADGSFTRVLPARIPHGRLVVELRPRASQTPEALRRWMDQAVAADDEWIGELLRRRLLGLKRRVMKDLELKRLNPHPGAVVYELTDPTLDDKPLVREGGKLRIRGAAERESPLAIVLHHAIEAGPAQDRHD